MNPKNPDNFLIEVTPEVIYELNRLYMHSDTEPVVVMHYSPYWREFAQLAPNQPTKANKEKDNGEGA